MEKHKCKLCLRSFSNGRALGGHMRSHMVNLTVHPKPDEPPPPPLVQLSFENESAPSSSSSPSLSSSSEDDDKALCYGLRENPKRSFRLVDPDFSFPVESASVILQDRESETESSKNNPTRTRSRRSCDNNNNQFHNHLHHQKKMKPSNDHHHHNHKKKTESSSWVEPEPVSSISDATTEEDVAFCLMMLSRDNWKRQEEKYDEEEEDDEEEEEEDNEEEDDEEERSVEDSDEFYEEAKSSKTRSSVRGRYKCETCKKVFRSYQALGGHRASHKKIKAAAAICEPEIEHENSNNNAPPPVAAEKKIHECPVCFRVFASGQALGGHKRTHVTGSAASVVVRSTPSTSKIGDNTNNGNSLIDLNLPAPVDEDDEMSQLENSSAVSDAEFIKPSSQIIEAQVG